MDNKEEIEVQEGQAQQAPIPVFLGYQPNKFSIKWDYENMTLARVGFMNPDFNHGFIKYLIREFRKRKVKLIRINSSNNPIDITEKDDFPLLDFEIMPTEEGLSELEETRMKWVQLYLKLLCYINNRTRDSFIPTMKYYKGQEGPFAGYVRAVEQMPEGEDKDTLLAHFRKLLVVDWDIINNEDGQTTDHVFTIKGESFNERLESFFLGAWCILNIQYARENNQVSENQIIMFLQLGEDLLIEGFDMEVREIIETTVKYLADLTLPSLDNLEFKQYNALFVQSPLLFPNVYPAVSHMIYGVNQTRDFDLQDLLPGMTPLIPNEGLYRSKVVLGNNEEFVKKVYLPIVE